MLCWIHVLGKWEQQQQNKKTQTLESERKVSNTYQFKNYIMWASHLDLVKLCFLTNDLGKCLPDKMIVKIHSDIWTIGVLKTALN